MMPRFKRMVLLIAMTATMVGLPVAESRADLMISPIRVVFGPRDRSATVQVLNTTKKTHTYRMNWLLMKMDENGKYRLVSAANDKDPYGVPNMVVFSPRQVTIQPQAYQLIRLSLRRPADLPPGEYKAHMAFTRLAEFGPERPDPDQKGVNMEVKVNVSFSIPVIVRNGEDKDLKISLSSPKLGLGGDIAKQYPVLNIDINRDAGSFSSYGTVKVMWQQGQEKEKQIGILNNVALYSEIKQRHISIPLTSNPTGGTLKVVYSGKYESEGTIWAQKSFPIGQ